MTMITRDLLLSRSNILNILTLFYHGYLTNAFYTVGKLAKMPLPHLTLKCHGSTKFGMLVGGHQNFLGKLVLS